MNINEELDKIEKYARENYIPVILKETRDLLTEQIRINKPKKILEIGTAIGFSGSLMLLENENSFLTTIEIDEELFLIAKQNFEKFNLSSRVNMILGDVAIEIKKLKDEFDFIFLDGPKSKYVTLLPILLKLLKKGGIIFADDVLIGGMVLTNEYPPHKHRSMVMNLRKFLFEVQNNKSIKYELIQKGEGMMIITKLE